MWLGLDLAQHGCPREKSALGSVAMRRPVLVFVAVLAFGCKAPPPPKVDLSARVVEPGPPQAVFGDQKRPPVDLNAARPEPKLMTPEQFETRFSEACNDRGKCNKYLVAAVIGGAPAPVAKNLTKMCWDLRKTVTGHLRAFATGLGRAEAAARYASYHRTPANCLEAERNDRAALVALEKDYASFDRETPEAPEMRAALDAVGKCHACDPAHLAACDAAKKAIAVMQKTATAKQDPYCKDLLRAPGGKLASAASTAL